MPIGIDRRFVLAGGCAALVGGQTNSLRAEAPAQWAYLKPGFTTLVIQYIRKMGLAQKNGVTLADPTEYSAVSTYYNDFSAGNYDICIGSWDVFAARYQAGVPLLFLCTITTSDMIFVLTGDNTVKTVEDMKGKTLAAAQSTGTYRLVSALVKERYGLELGKDVEIQGVDNPAAAMTLVMADRATAGLSWEPNITAALHRRPDLRTIFNAGQVYREMTQLELPYFGVAVSRDWAKRNPALVAGVRQTFADAINGINLKPQDAVDAAGAGSGFEPAIMTDAIASRRLNFSFASMAEPKNRASLMKAGDFMQRYGLLTKPLDEGFFVTT
jgi:NitT/TauT family transport system substrate-binding protein